MTDPAKDDDLHGRQVVLLLLFFGSAGGGLYFFGRLTGPGFWYDNPVACAALAGAACYPARFLVERFTRRRHCRRDRRY